MKGITKEEIEWLVKRIKVSNYFDSVCSVLKRNSIIKNDKVVDYKKACLIGLRILKNI
jgi:hypothetical protein